MFGNLTGWHALILLAVVVLIFGAAKLPALARSLGQSVRILKKEVKATDTNAAESALETGAADPAFDASEYAATAAAPGIVAPQRRD